MVNDILILGGTKMARLLAENLGQKHNVTYSIAGSTKAAKLPKYCKQITGGFGGAKGLADYIRKNHIKLCIDATHPFAQNISQNAITACNETNIEVIEYARKIWDVETAYEFTKEADLIAALPLDAKILLTIGSQNIVPFLSITQQTWARMIEPPKLDKHTLPKDFEILLSRPPYHLNDEMALMKKHGITHLICKNSGGEKLANKLIAAQNLSINILMLTRPQSPHKIQLFNSQEIEAYLNSLEFVSPS